MSHPPRMDAPGTECVCVCVTTGMSMRIRKLKSLSMTNISIKSAKNTTLSSGLDPKNYPRHPSPTRSEHSVQVDKGASGLVASNAVLNKQLSYRRDRAAGWVSYGQKWKTGTGRQYLRTLQAIFNHCDVFGQQSNQIRKLRAITPSKVIAVGTNLKPVCDFLLVINSDNISRTVAELSQLIVQILNTLHF